jgi:hypothetical protein
MYAALGPSGLRLLTPTVVWAELLAVPIALFGSFLGHRSLVNVTIGLICSLHIGIALTVRNTVLLSLVACSAWSVFLPPPLEHSYDKKKLRVKPCPTRFKNSLLGTLLIFCMIGGSIWFEGFSMECNQSMKHIWSTLLHNRWNVFIGAEGKFRNTECLLTHRKITINTTNISCRVRDLGNRPRTTCRWVYR